MRQWKIAVSLAIVGAAATPFVFHTWKSRPTSEVRVPLTAQEKERISAYMKETKYCQTTAHRIDEAKALGVSPVPMDAILPDIMCEEERDSLERGATINYYPSLPKYLAINLAVALGAFGSIFGLSFLVPMLIRRYWNWLKT